MRIGTRLALRAVVVGTATAMAATLVLTGPAQADEHDSSGAQEHVGMPAGMVSVEVNQLSQSRFQITGATESYGATGLPASQLENSSEPAEATVVAGDNVVTPTSEHHIIDGRGFEWAGPYCDLTRAGQGLLIVGELTYVAGAICYFGVIACPLAGAAAAAAAWYLIEYGRCPGNLRVRYNFMIPVGPPWSIRCV